MTLNVRAYIHPALSSVSGDSGWGRMGWGLVSISKVLIRMFCDTAFILYGAHAAMGGVNSVLLKCLCLFIVTHPHICRRLNPYFICVKDNDSNILFILCEITWKYKKNTLSYNLYFKYIWLKMAVQLPAVFAKLQFLAVDCYTCVVFTLARWCILMFIVSKEHVIQQNINFYFKQ